jgi:hypothetical protein
VSENLTPFAPGKSGNPGGRPKNTPNLFNILVKVLDEDHANFETPTVPMSNAEVVCRRMVSQAAGGDHKARTELLNRVLGKPKEFIEHSGVIDTVLTDEERQLRLNALLNRVHARGSSDPGSEDDAGGTGGA